MDDRLFRLPGESGKVEGREEEEVKDSLNGERVGSDNRRGVGVGVAEREGRKVEPRTLAELDTREREIEREREGVVGGGGGESGCESIILLQGGEG